MKVIFFLYLSLAAFFASPVFAEDYKVGVFYFPGWTDKAVDVRPFPWEAIKKFPEREPKLGWYQDDNPNVIKQQIQWMGDYGIDFVVFDWYWDGERTFLNKPIDNYLALNSKQSKNKNVKFALLWANHRPSPLSFPQFDAMVNFWIDNYFKDSRYLTNSGAPSIIIFSPLILENSAKKLESSTKQLFDRARKIAVARGLPGIYFIAATQANAEAVVKTLPVIGYDAFTAYNYHLGMSGKPDGRRSSHSYPELADGYEETWSWILKNSTLPYFLPIISGWDRRPWGGSEDPKHDNSSSDLAQFRRHLLRARSMLDQNPIKTQKTVIVCCWNEYGEGSYIEPTKRDGFAYLEALKSTFK